MKYKKDFSNVNFSTIIHSKKTISNFDNVIEQAYYAGMITKYGTLTIFGTGAERGTWGQFANICMSNIEFTNAKTALTFFTDIYSTALRNQGKTCRKRSFYLSQMQEIKPLVNFFGLHKTFNDQWEDIKYFDFVNGLTSEMASRGRIKNWETRTKRFDLRFENCQDDIMDSVCQHMIAQESVINSLQDKNITDPTEFLSLTFIEGLRGLSLTLDDISCLRKGESVIARYYKKVA